MYDRKRPNMLLVSFLISALLLAGCGLLGSADKLEEGLRNSGINNLEIDLKPEILNQKLENVEPDENGVFEVTFTESEVNEMLLIRRADESEGEAEDLQNFFIRFEENEVVLDTDLGSLFDDVLVARFVPLAADGAIQVDLQEASIGPVDVPVQFLNGLEGAMNRLMETMIDTLPTANSLLSVEVEEGSLTLVAQQKD